MGLAFELVMGGEKKGLRTPQRPPQEVSRRPRTAQGPELGPNLGSKKGPKRGPKLIKFDKKLNLRASKIGDPRGGTPKKEKDPKIIKNRLKIHAMWAWIFHRFFNDFD